MVTPRAMSDVIDIAFSFRGDKSAFTISGPCSGEPGFFSLRLNRDSSNEKYSFHCLVVQHGVFHLSAFENRFLIDRKRRALVLQADQHCLDVNPDLITETVLSDSGETVDVNSVGKINFDQLYDESDEVNFTLTNGDRSLFVLVEGEPSKEALRLPVIFDTSRFARLFKDDNFNGVYRPGKGSVVFDSQESEPVFFRQSLPSLMKSASSGTMIEAKEFHFQTFRSLMTEYIKLTWPLLLTFKSVKRCPPWPAGDLSLLN